MPAQIPRNPLNYKNIWNPAFLAFPQTPCTDGIILGNSIACTISGGTPNVFNLQSDGNKLILNFDLPAGITIAIRANTVSTNQNDKIPAEAERTYKTACQIGISNFVGTSVIGGFTFQLRQYTSLGGQTTSTVDSAATLRTDRPLTNYEQDILLADNTQSITPVFLITADVAISGTITLENFKLYKIPLAI